MSNRLNRVLSCEVPKRFMMLAIETVNSSESIKEFHRMFIIDTK
jgi:hypothetical protein